VTHLLEMRGISKSFPGVKALSDVGITLDRGEVLGIVGENGAGKSTLMKILAGVFAADAGTLFRATGSAPSGARRSIARRRGCWPASGSRSSPAPSSARSASPSSSWWRSPALCRARQG
jgi:ABC-type sugar transport system ATPase subunit